MKSKIINQLNQKDTELNSVIETILETETIIQMLEKNYYRTSMEKADTSDVVNVNTKLIKKFKIKLIKKFNINLVTKMVLFTILVYFLIIFYFIFYFFNFTF